MSEHNPASRRPRQTARERPDRPAPRRDGARAHAASPPHRAAESLGERRRASLAISNLRGIAVAFVVMTHASVAYLFSAPAQTPPFDQPPYQWVAFPIVDAHRWLGFDIFCAWQDVFLMCLLFFLSGLFAFSSAERDGPAKYLRRRLLRLGAPLAFGVTVVMPAALYPTYLMTALDPNLADYFARYLTKPFTPCGPLWFLGVLLALTIAAVALRRQIRPAVLYIGWRSLAFETRPTRTFILWSLIAIVAYAPLALAFTPFRWVNWGPFALQLSRPALYTLYFCAGLGVGAVGLGVGLLRADGFAARRWKVWGAAAAASLFLWMGLVALTLQLGDASPLPLRLAADAAYGVAGACGVMFALGTCLRFGADRPWPVAAKLSDNAFGVYVLHYAPVVWLQYALLGVEWPAPVKALIVAIGGGAACLAALAVAQTLAGLLPRPGRRPATS